VQLHCRLVATWRCPHCDTPQADGARCWACSRHPLACGSCRNYVRAVAGRLGYCALDRTRAVLQGDEIRACWQAPSRPEPFEGLFSGLDADEPTDDAAVTPVLDASRDGALAATRTWAIHIVGDASSRVTPSSSGLRDATFVPARGIARTPATGVMSAASDDPEGQRVAQDPPIRQGDPDADEALAHGGILGDPDP
jgi:hypothetical protein